MSRSIAVFGLLCAALLVAGSAFGQWVARAPLPTPRQEVAVAELGGRVVVVGGFGALGQILDTVEIYDPVLDEWSDAAPLPRALHHAAAASIEGTLYVVGGWTDFFQTPRAELYAYDPIGDEWIEREPMPSARGSPAAVSFGGVVYAIGGSPNASDVAAYRPDLDEWEPLPALPTARNHLGAAVLLGRIFAVGGRIGSIGPEQNTGVVEIFDPVAVEWSEGAPMPTPRSGHAVATYRGLLFAFGGEGNPDAPDGIFDETEAYDPASGEWTAFAPMPTGRHGIGAAALADGVHIPGGGPVEGFGTSDVHEVFVPEPRGSAWLALAMLALIRAQPRFCTFAHSSRKLTVRLKTSALGFESGSTAK